VAVQQEQVAARGQLPLEMRGLMPTPKYRTFQGFSRPFWRRRLAIGESASDVRYSTHSIISCTEPLPTFPLI